MPFLTKPKGKSVARPRSTRRTGHPASSVGPLLERTAGEIRVWGTSLRQRWDKPRAATWMATAKGLPPRGCVEAGEIGRRRCRGPPGPHAAQPRKAPPALPSLSSHASRGQRPATSGGGPFIIRDSSCQRSVSCGGNRAVPREVSGGREHVGVNVPPANPHGHLLWTRRRPAWGLPPRIRLRPLS